MTTKSQHSHFSQSSPFMKKVQWSNYQSYYSKQISFVNVKRSRKGTRLNIPEEFYTRPKEQSFIGRIVVLPAGGCGDMDYVLNRKNAYKQLLFRQDQMYTNKPHYSPSVTINIRTPTPYNQPQFYSGCYEKVSHSTISINPTINSEEPWVPQSKIIPTGLYCPCGSRNLCDHTQSKEQRVVNLDVPENTADEKYVYVTAAPKISPLNSCWKFLMCKRKKNKGEIYMPTVMTRNEHTQKCVICPSCSKANTHTASLIVPGKNQIVNATSRLSTITESEISVSEYSSEEFNTHQRKDKTEDSTMKLGYSISRQMKPEPSYNYDPSEFTSFSFNPQGQVYRWVCEPTKGKKKFTSSGRKQYICYMKE